MGREVGVASVSAAASAVPRVLRCIWALKDVICFFCFFFYSLYFSEGLPWELKVV